MNRDDGTRARVGFGGLLIVGALIVVLLLGSFALVQAVSGPAQREIGLTELTTAITQQTVRRIVVVGDELQVQFYDGSRAVSRKEPKRSLYQTLAAQGLTDRELDRLSFGVEPPTDGFWSIGIWLILGFVFVGLFLFMRARAANREMDRAVSMSKSPARVWAAARPTVKFDDVAGADEAKQELHEVVEFLKSPSKFQMLGARIPRGVLLAGPPGTGKTLFARAVAGEADVPFFSISGSEFVEMFVGVGASRVRDLFDQAKRNAPCIIFVDEIDAVGRQRGVGLNGGNDEREQTLNQVLVEMDGFDTNTNVIVIAATNRPDILDPALLRPGRFDRHVVLDAPDVRGREAILRLHVRGKPIAAEVDLAVVAKQTPGFCGADLANLVNEAAILAVRRGKREIGVAELEEAADRVMAGPERKSRVISPREKAIVAYHEAGHAVVAHFLPDGDPVHKVTIVPRGRAGGFTQTLPEIERGLWRRGQLRDMLAYGLGGMVAEELRYGEASIGSQSDVQRVTDTARRMVTEYGMSSAGLIAFERRLGKFARAGSEPGFSYSEQSAELIDQETRTLVDEAKRRARELVTRHRAGLDSLAAALQERETLGASEVLSLLGPRPSREPAARAA